MGNGGVLPGDVGRHKKIGQHKVKAYLLYVLGII